MKYLLRSCRLVIFLIAISVMQFAFLNPANAEDSATTVNRCKVSQDAKNQMIANAKTALDNLKIAVDDFNTRFETTILNNAWGHDNLSNKNTGRLLRWNANDKVAVNNLGDSDIKLNNIDLKYTGYNIEQMSNIINSANVKKTDTYYKDYQKCKAHFAVIKTLRTQIDTRWREAHKWLILADSSDVSNEGKDKCDIVVNDSSSSSGSSSGSGSGSSSNGAMNSDDCRTIQEYAADMEDCPLCVIFERILKVDKNLASGSFSKIAPSLINVLKIAFSIFLAYQVLIAVGNPAGMSIGKLLTTIAMQGFKVLVAILLLSNATVLYDYAITPILSSGIDAGLSFSSDAALISKVNTAGQEYSFPSATSGDSATDVLSSSFLQKVMGGLRVFNEKTMELPGIGRAMMCKSWNEGIMKVIPKSTMLVEGGIIFCVGIMLSLAVSFYLIDTCVSLGIVVSIVPFLIACWAFKQTAGYANVGWQFILDIFFNFLFTGLIISCASALIAVSITPDLTTALNSNDVASIEEKFGLFSQNFLLFMIATFISFKLVGSIQQLASKFSGGGTGINFGAMLGGTMAGAATGAFLGSKGDGSGGIYGAMKSGLGNIGNGLKNVSDNSGLTNKAKSFSNNMKNKIGNTIGKHTPNAVRNAYNKTKGATAAVRTGKNSKAQGGRGK